MTDSTVTSMTELCTLPQGELDLIPGPRPHQSGLLGNGSVGTGGILSTWGGAVVQDSEDNSTWHMFAAAMLGGKSKSARPQPAEPGRHASALWNHARSGWISRLCSLAATYRLRVTTRPRTSLKQVLHRTKRRRGRSEGDNKLGEAALLIPPSPAHCTSSYLEGIVSIASKSLSLSAGPFDVLPNQQ